MSWTSVEKAFIARSGRKDSYEGERAPTIEVQNVYELGKLVALSFLEWVCENPNGVVALPTGRTPEYFIKTLERYLSGWHREEIQSEMRSFGFDVSGTAPDTSNLKFVMLDEFFPMLPTHRNSFCNYIRIFYARILNIKRENILHFDLLEEKILTLEEFNEYKTCDVDLTLLSRAAVNDDEVRRQSILQRVQAYCDSYESRVRALGGIGFFLGGIGPDGHIAFNQEGAPHESTTRLVNFNYPTAAAAASDLGGIEIARGKAAMTIGLATITYNKSAKVIIMAAGEGKATVIREGIEEPADVKRPSSVLHSLKNGRFYITHGAANLLTARKAERIANVSHVSLTWALQHLAGTDTSPSGLDWAHMVEPNHEYQIIEDLLYQTSIKVKKPVHCLTLSDLEHVHEAKSLPSWMIDNSEIFNIFVVCASRRLREKIEGGLRAISCLNKRVLHTAPHHDDIMLSYHGAMHELLGRQPVGKVFYKNSVANMVASGGGVVANAAVASAASNTNDLPVITRTRSGSFSCTNTFRLGEAYNGNINHFAYLTSGFHSVNDDFLQTKVNTLRGSDLSYYFLRSMINSGEVTRDYDDIMAEFHEAFFAKDYQIQDRVENIIFIRKVAEVWRIHATLNYNLLFEEIKSKVEWVRCQYLENHQPGDGIPIEIQLLKGCMRESEVDRVWALSRMPMNRIHHMRSKFYNDDFFTPMPNLEDDAMPMANLIKLRQPEIVTVAFDPEGTGPDTHYKVLQVVAAGLRLALDRGDLNVSDPIVWGYRNVWFVFSPSDTTLMVPCTSEDLDLMHDTFMSCFTTQKAASFPSPHYDGPFSAWARQIQRNQRNQLVTLLGEDYFTNHHDERVRACGGFIFLKAMHIKQFLRETEDLKSKFENIA